MLTRTPLDMGMRRKHPFYFPDKTTHEVYSFCSSLAMVLSWMLLVPS